MDRFNSCIIYICLEGSATFRSDGAPDEATISRGGSVLIPWGVGEATVVPGAEGVTLLQATIPPVPEKPDEYIDPNVAATLPEDEEEDR